jgi:aspartyl protease
MKFRYKKYGPDVLRPVIPIEITYEERSIKYEALVDSGADFCIFDAQIAAILGIQVENGQSREVAGITGTKEKYYVHSITLKIGGWPYKTDVGFLPNIARLGYGVVGQRGFFDKFVVKFDLQKEEIELNEKKN